VISIGLANRGFSIVISLGGPFANEGKDAKLISKTSKTRYAAVLL